MKGKFLLGIIFCFFLSTLVRSKVSSCKHNFKSEQWLYCSKFGSPPMKEFSAEIKAKLQRRYKREGQVSKVEVGVYQFAAFHELNIMHKPSCQEQRSRAISLFEVELNEDGSFGESRFVSIVSGVSPEIFFFVAMDCEQILHKKHKSMPRVEVEIEFFNEGGNHFSYEDQGQISLHVVLIVLFALLLGSTIYGYVLHYREFSRMDSPHFMMILALFLHIGALFLNLFHLIVYTWNGKGIPIFDIFALIGHMFSEITITCLLMLIASGWTLTFTELDWDSSIDVYLPIGAVVLAVHLVLAAMTYVDLDDYHKYHDYAGAQGWVLIGFKVVIFLFYLYFILGYKDTIPSKSKRFHRLFSILGSLYSLSVPIVVVSLYFMEPFNRQWGYTFLTNLVQVLCVGFLLQQQMSTKTEYFKASLFNAGLLPTTKLD